MNLIDLIKDKEMILITGKGGVGKSTFSAALSLYLMQNNPILAIDIDPAHSLPDVFGVKVKHNQTQPIINSSNQLSLLLNTPGKIVKQVYDGAEKKLKNRAEGLPTYQSVMHLYSVVRQLGFPIAMKGFASLNTTVNERHETLKQNPDTKVICDLEPSNATLELLEDANYAVERLQTMADNKKKISWMAKISGWGDIAEFVENKDFMSNINEYARNFEEFNKNIKNPDKTAFIIMSEPTPVVLNETSRLRTELEELDFPVSAIIFNKNYGEINPEELKGTPLEHWPEHHKTNATNYIKQNTTFKGKYFSIPPLEIGIAKTQKAKQENLKYLIESVRELI